jgi:hypothetical protein
MIKRMLLNQCNALAGIDLYDRRKIMNGLLDGIHAMEFASHGVGQMKLIW